MLGVILTSVSFRLVHGNTLAGWSRPTLSCWCRALSLSLATKNEGMRLSKGGECLPCDPGSASRKRLNPSRDKNEGMHHMGGGEGASHVTPHV